VTLKPSSMPEAFDGGDYYMFENHFVDTDFGIKVRVEEPHLLTWFNRSSFLFYMVALIRFPNPS
jgi:hypothetical protein